MPSRTVSSGATFVVSSGVTDIGDIVTDLGSLLIVASGGTTISTTVINGGTQEVAGVDSASTVSDGTEVVDSGGIASDLTVAGTNAPQLIVSAGGSAVGAFVFSGGNEIVSSGGLTVGITVSRGGLLNVKAGGSSTSGTITDGGIEQVFGVAISETIGSGGTQRVVNGGTTTGTLNSGGTEVISSGGTAIDDVIVAGTENVFGGGTATVTDGTNTARLVMLGQHVATNFLLTNDGHGGTLVSDPPVSSGSAIAPPH